jgi:hypothetical protein
LRELTKGKAKGALHKVDNALSSIRHSAQDEEEGVDDGGEDALDDLKDRLEKVTDSCCDTHFCLFWLSFSSVVLCCVVKFGLGL